MSHQFSIWLDEKTAKDLDTLSCYEERKRGAMVKVLIRRAARQLTRADLDSSFKNTLFSEVPPCEGMSHRQKQRGTHATE